MLKRTSRLEESAFFIRWGTGFNLFFVALSVLHSAIHCSIYRGLKIAVFSSQRILYFCLDLCYTLVWRPQQHIIQETRTSICPGRRKGAFLSTSLARQRGMEKVQQQERAIDVFCCYAHEDESLLDELKRHLSPQQRQQLINLWYDRDIRAGTEWKQEIEKRLSNAHIILLLISPDFLSSDYCYSLEMKHALELHKRGATRVIPVLLRPINGWKKIPPGDIQLGQLQALPRDARPITSWADHDKAWKDVTEGIGRVVNELLSTSRPLPLPPSPGEKITLQIPNPLVQKSGGHHRFRRFPAFFLLCIAALILLSGISSRFLFLTHSLLPGTSPGVTPSGGLPFVAPAWKTSPVGIIRSSPRVVNGIVYITSEDRKVYAYSTTACGANKQCQPLWSSEPTGGPIDSSPAVVAGKVYVASGDGKLYAYDADGCGKQKPSCPPLWSSQQVEAPRENARVLFSSPAVANGVVYMSSIDARLYAYNAEGCGKEADCPFLWRTDSMGYPENSSPTVANGVVYIGGSFDQKLYAYAARGCGNSSNCPFLWSGKVGDFISFSSPRVVDDTVYIASYDGKIYAFNANGCGRDISGRTLLFCVPLWASEPTGKRIDGSPAVADGILFIGSEDQKVYAYDLNTCKSNLSKAACLLWVSAPTGDGIASSPTVANGVLYIGSSDNILYAYDTKTCRNQKSSCRPLWRSQAMATSHNFAFSSPTIAKGSVYIGSISGSLYAFPISS